MTTLDNSTITLNGSGYSQFGKQVLITQMRFATLEAVFEVDPEVQRKLDPRRRSEIREFILNSVEKDYFYFSPFVFSARGRIRETERNWVLEPGCKVYILDGMHRCAALSSAISHLKTKREALEESGRQQEAKKVQESIDKLKDYPVSMQIYIDLNTREERQLFTDINTERREAHVGYIMQYDHRDKYVELTRGIVSELENKLEIEIKLSRISLQSSAITSTAIMRKCLIALFEGNLTAAIAGDSFNKIDRIPDHKSIACAFFESWLQLFPNKAANRKRFVAGYTGIQVALAYTIYLLVKDRSLSYIDAINRLKTLNEHCTWKLEDPLFSHLYDPSSGRIKYHSSSTAIQKTALQFLLKIK